jgi:hypothetical protein
MRTYIVVLFTTPPDCVRVSEETKPEPLVVDIWKPVGAVIVILLERLLPETVNVCSALAVLVQAVKARGPPVVLIIAQLVTVTEVEDGLVHFPLSVCVAVKTLPLISNATGIVHVEPDQLTEPAFIELPLLRTTI